MVEEILQCDWKEKKPYSSTPSIGNPEWVIEKTKELKQQRSLQQATWKLKFKEKFG
ncbi:MAG: hypothetical protein HYU97_04215 [Deltaproteobacteria bacterium]|nr:hypothetical protein [Deltaproteobacteria bacterium]